MLKLLKGGKLVSTDWDCDTQSYKTTELDHTFPYLYHDCELEDGLRFKDLVSLIRADCELYSRLLTSGPWLGEMVEEGDKPYVREEDNITHLEIGWSAEIIKYNGPDELIDYTIIHGIGEGGPYALDFSPINTLTELELKLNTEYNIYDMRNVSANTPVLLTAKKQFSLLDILRGVFWELSFHGSIKNRDQRCAQLKQTVEDIDSGKEKLIPWEDIKEGWANELEEQDTNDTKLS